MTAWTLTEARISFNGKRVTPDLNVFLRRSTLLPRARNQLAKDALEWGADYLLWIDGDHRFPRDALFRLLSLNLPVVGANYPTRAQTIVPTAAALSGEPLVTTEVLAKAREVEEVLHMGLGFCLVDMRVVRALRNGTPLFQTTVWGEGTDEYVGEDVYFFRRVREMGFRVHVDHALSWAMGHVHQRLLTNADVER